MIKVLRHGVSRSGMDSLIRLEHNLYLFYPATTNKCVVNLISLRNVLSQMKQTSD